MPALDAAWLKGKGPGGVPRWVLAAGAGVGLYLLYRWYSNSQASSSTDQGTTAGYDSTSPAFAGGGFPSESPFTPAGADTTATLGTCPDGSKPDASGNCAGAAATPCPPGTASDGAGGCVSITGTQCPPGTASDGAGGCIAVESPCPPGKVHGPGGGCHEPHHKHPKHPHNRPKPKPRPAPRTHGRTHHRAGHR